MRIVLIAGFIASLLIVSISPALAYTVTLSPIADAFVNEGSPNTTYNLDYLNVSNSANTPDEDRWVYVKYDLSGLPNDADVSMAYINWYTYGVTADANAPERDVNFFHVIDDGWSETSITWNNKPSHDDYMRFIYSPGLAPGWKKGYIDYDAAGFDNWNESVDLVDDYLSVVMQCTDDNFYRSIAGYSQNLSAGPELYVEYTTAVPIPGAVWLLGSGLIGMFGARRKFKK